MQIDFPIISDLDVAFGEYPKEWFNNILKIEDTPEDKKWFVLASNLFFKGGTIPINKNLSEEYRYNGYRILKAVMSSFNCKHEDKEKVCGFILKSLCE